MLQWKNFQNSVVPSLRSVVTFHPVDINKKLGTVKEEVSKIIFCNFEWHCSLGSEVHLFIPLGVVFCYKTLRVCLNNQNVFFSIHF